MTFAFLGVLALGCSMSSLFWGVQLVLLGLALGSWFEGKVGKGLLLGTAVAATLGVSATLTMSGPEGEPFLEELRLPGGEPLPPWTSLLPERDAALLSAPFVTTSDEHDGLSTALEVVYDELERDVPFRRTTQLRTLLGAQSQQSSDAHMHRVATPRDWVVFLHGFGGNTVSGCWVIADLASRAGWNTICPSTSLDGRWWRGDGPGIVGAPLRFARRRGAQRFVIVGYSNGAVGALRIVADDVDSTFDGLVLLSGFSPVVDATRIHVPTLALMGDRDERFRSSALASWAQGSDAIEVRLAPGADHMLIVKDRRWVQEAIGGFLDRLSADGSARTGGSSRARAGASRGSAGAARR